MAFLTTFLHDVYHQSVVLKLLAILVHNWHISILFLKFPLLAVWNDTFQTAQKPIKLLYFTFRIGRENSHIITLIINTFYTIICFSDACSQEDPLLAFQAPCFPILANGDDACINFVRSAATFKGYRYPRTRQQINLITSYVDGSQIYGSSQERANELRDLSSMSNN